MNEAVVPWAIGCGAAALCGAGVFCRAVFMPRSQICGPVIWRGDASNPPRIALTFDDGPHPIATPRILDILREQDVPATFFAIGRHIDANPDLLRRIDDEGHLIGNHSYDHDTFGVMHRTLYWRDQIARTNDRIQQIIGERPALFRPPMGFRTFHIAREAARDRHTVVTWTRRAFDGLHTTSQRIVERLSIRVRAGDILLLHDGEVAPFRRNLDATVAALRTLIAVWRSRGLQIVRLDELLSVAPYQR